MSIDLSKYHIVGNPMSLSAHYVNLPVTTDKQTKARMLNLPSMVAVLDFKNVKIKV